MVADTWACIAGGPSLTAEDVQYCRDKGWKIASVNMGYLLDPDLFHACDDDWWDEYGAIALKALPEDCEIYTGSKAWADKEHLTLITYGTNAKGPIHCSSGALSGHQLIEIVARYNPERIILLGYDGHGTHWHSDYPKHMRNAWQIEKHNQVYDNLKDLPVINCSPGTHIKSFPTMALKNVE